VNAMTEKRGPGRPAGTRNGEAKLRKLFPRGVDALAAALESEDELVRTIAGVQVVSARVGSAGSPRELIARETRHTDAWEGV
jgi:hypothetical protein